MQNYLNVIVQKNSLTTTSSKCLLTFLIEYLLNGFTATTVRSLFIHMSRAPDGIGTHQP